MEPHGQSPLRLTNARVGRHPGPKLAHSSMAKGRGFLLPGQMDFHSLKLGPKLPSAPDTPERFIRIQNVRTPIKCNIMILGKNQ